MIDSFRLVNVPCHRTVFLPRTFSDKKYYSKSAFADGDAEPQVRVKVTRYG